MNQNNYYVSDIFFKFNFGQNEENSKRLQLFLLKNIIPDVPGYLQKTIYVYLPYINEIAKEKEILNEFKERMVTMMKKKYEKFMGNNQMVKERDKRYQAQFDFQEYHDYDVEYTKKEKSIEIAISQCQIKYQENGGWLKQCSEKQLDYFSQLIISDIGYEELKEKVLNFSDGEACK